MAAEPKNQHDRYLAHRVQETLEWMHANYDEDVDEADALDHLMGECGQMQDGGCSMAGSEYCDFECPFSN